MFEEKFFLVQIHHKGAVWTKGVVVHDNLDAARQGFHAYLGAYGYGHDPDVDFVECCVVDMGGRVRDSCVDDRIPRPAPEQETEA